METMISSVWLILVKCFETVMLFITWGLVRAWKRVWGCQLSVLCLHGSCNLLIGLNPLTGNISCSFHVPLHQFFMAPVVLILTQGQRSSTVIPKEKQSFHKADLCSFVTSSTYRRVREQVGEWNLGYVCCIFPLCAVALWVLFRLRSQ